MIGLFFGLILSLASVTGILLNHPELLRTGRPESVRGAQGSREGPAQQGGQAPDSRGGGRGFRGGASLLLRHPTNQSRMLALSQGVLSLSEDAGISWHPASMPDGLTGIASASFAPDCPDIYMIGRSGELFRTVDLGMSWSPVPGPSFPQGRVRVLGLAAGASGILSILTQNCLYRREADGSWLESAPPFGSSPERPERGARGGVGLERIVRGLHSGDILGVPGRLVMDASGLATVALFLTGVWLSLRCGFLRRLINKRRDASGRRSGHL
jgi:hypothetical protein